jgi:hypothetical protein
MSAVKKAREWFAWHSVTKHIVAPLWLRLPEKHRWTVVHHLNKGKRQCWSDLVSDALAYRESDPCDINTPSPLSDTAKRCRTTCDWMHPDAHSGKHACSCYCGKFQFTAAEGSHERKAACMAWDREAS